jgi:mono/diheme cytochrome c family protein
MPTPSHQCRPQRSRLGALAFSAIAFSLSAGLASLAGTAQADTLAMPTLPAYTQECAACHMAYPPGLLPAASWQRLVANLSRHFGTDASLDQAMQQQLAAWLQSNAGSFKKVARDPAPPPQDRISQSAWFVREHREVGSAVWKRKSIGSAANCVACHRSAAQGRFSEHDITIPQ